jgi:hypothetical protein
MIKLQSHGSYLTDEKVFVWVSIVIIVGRIFVGDCVAAAAIIVSASAASSISIIISSISSRSIISSISSRSIIIIIAISVARKRSYR